MAQGTGVHFNAWKLIVWMAYVRGIKSREPGFYLLYVKKSFSGQNRIIAFHGMPFAQDKTIPVPVIHKLRRNVHLPEIQVCQDLHHAEIASDMSGPGPADHIQHILSHFISHY